MTKYQKYAEYKDSGLEWLGSIPSHWEVKKLKYLGEAIIGLTYSPDDVVDEGEGTLVLRSSNIQNKKLAFDDNVYVNKEIPEKLRTKKNDILICARNGSRALIGKNALIDESAEGVSFGAFMSIFRSKYNNYLSKVFNSALFEYQSGTFLTATINQLTTGNLNSFEVPLPPLEERELIANFLDHETAKIDTLIAKQEKLIELLKEKRQAVISHAVTKGLNPNVAMKDSGVEWLGQVPEHWILSNLKYFASIQGGYAFNSDLFVEEGTQVLRIGNVYQNTLSLDRQPIYISNELVKNFKDFIVSKNDVLMSLTGTLGKRDYGFAIKVKTDEKYLLNQRVAKISPNPSKIDTDFMVYVLWSESYLTQLYSLPSGTKQANLSNSDVLGIQIVVPPSLEEQKDIAKYLKNKLLKFDDMILKAESAISLMQERRTALISAAVTGKIDVRNWQHPNEEKKGLIS